MMQRPMNSEELKFAVMLKVVAGAAYDCGDHLGRVLGKEKCARAEQIGDELMQMHWDCLTATGDCEQAELAKRRAGALRVSVSHVKQKPLDTMIHLTADECTTLIGHALNYCAMECPYAAVSEDGCTVDKAAVKGCELQKLYRRIGLVDSGIVQQGCPYYDYVY